jgi:hypothetical protein
MQKTKTSKGFAQKSLIQIEHENEKIATNCILIQRGSFQQDGLGADKAWLSEARWHSQAHGKACPIRFGDSDSYLDIRKPSEGLQRVARGQEGRRESTGERRLTFLAPILSHSS